MALVVLLSVLYLLFIPIAAIIAAVVILVRKDEIIIKAIKTTSIILGIGVVVAFFVTFALGFLVGMLAILAILFGLLLLVTPVILMLNFVLCAIVFSGITDGLKGKLKTWMAVSLISFGIFFLMTPINIGLFIRLLDISINNLMEDIGFEWFLFMPAAIWVFSTLITHWTMFVYALRIPPEYNKKIWVGITFIFPVVGPLLYIFRQKIKKFSSPA